MLNIHEVINNVKVDTDYERAIFRAFGMLRERAYYWEECEDHKDIAGAYESAADILAYAMMEDWAALNNFDYYEHKDCEVK